MREMEEGVRRGGALQVSVLPSKCRGCDLIVLTTFRNFDFKEKEAVDKYYPQYYHKTDIVRHHLSHHDKFVRN